MRSNIVVNFYVYFMRVFAIVISLIGMYWFREVAWIGIILANVLLLWQDIQSFSRQKDIHTSTILD